MLIIAVALSTFHPLTPDKWIHKKQTEKNMIEPLNS